MFGFHQFDPLPGPLALTTAYISKGCDDLLHSKTSLIYGERFSSVLSLSSKTNLSRNSDRTFIFYISKTILNPTPDSNHIIALPFPLLTVFNQSEVNATFRTVNEFSLPHRIMLHFDGWMVAQNWDENNLSSSQKYCYPPQHWQRIWPEHLNHQTIEKLLPLLLNHYPLQDQAYTTIKLLDGYMIFRVEMEGSDESHDRSSIIKFNSSIPISLVIQSHDQPTNLSKETVLSHEFRYQFHQNTLTRIISNLFTTFTTSYSTLSHHSFLISAPSGSGKTIFLRKLLDDLNGEKPAGYEKVQVQSHYFDLKSLSTDIDTLLQFQENQAFVDSLLPIEETFQQSYNFLVSHLFPSKKHQDSYNSDENRMIVYAIDSLEVLYQPFLKESNPDMETLPYYLEDYYRLLAYHLHIICSYLKDHQVSETLRVYFVGATSLPVNRIPNSSIGCFQMELNLLLPKPSFVDRCYLCYQFLKDCFRIDSLQDLRQDTPLWMAEEIRGIFYSEQPVSPLFKKIENLYIWAYRLAGLTQGYLPGDLSKFMKKLQSQVLLQDQLKPREEETDDTKQTKEDLIMKICDWDSVLTVIATNSLQAMDELDSIEQYADLSSHLTWDSFIGYEDIIHDIQSLLRPLLKPSSIGLQPSTTNSTSLLSKYRFPKGMVLYGPSGCGKTFLAKIISKQLKANLIPIQSADILSKYFGDTEAKIRKYFSIAHQIAPCVLFFDEFDALAHRREFHNPSESSHGSIFNRILSTFLNELDGIALPATQTNNDARSSFVFVIVACKSVEMLDEALVRPGRLQYHVHLDYPSEEDIALMLRQELSPYHFEILPHHLQQFYRIPHLTLAIVKEFVERIKRQAIKDRIESGLFTSEIREGSEHDEEGRQQLAMIREKDWHLAIENYLSAEDIISSSPAIVFSTEFAGNFSFNSGI